jgi:hypothetical protein
VVSGERFPAGADGVAGLMTGAAEPDPRQIASFAPGAFAEHLTSLAAEFHRPIQTKITEWLLAGATCSAGTVTEPMSVWSKFPSARIFAHLAAGASMLEALAESVACPLQLFSVGDPLSRPWGGTLPVRLEGPPSVTGRTVFRASAEGAEIWMFLLDGRRVALSASPEFFLDPVVTAPGWHVLRAVAYGPGLVRNQGYAEIGFECSPSGRRAVLDAGPGERVYSTLKTASVRVRAEGATRVAVYALGRKLAEAPGADAILSIRPDEAGEGPVVLQPVALFPEGGAIRGRPVPVVFAPPRSPPALRLQRSGSRSHPLWILSSAAPEAGAISWVVRAPAWDSGWRGTRLSPDTTFSGGTAAVDRAGLRLNPSVSNLFSVCAWPAGTETGWAAEAMLEPEGRGFPRKGFAYLAWDVCDDGSFQFFGMNGESGAWVRGEGRPGRLTIRESRGAPLRRGQRYALAVRTGGSDEAAECYAGETRIFSVPRPRDRKAGRWGVVSGSADAVFARVEREWPLGRSSPDGAAITVRPPDGLSPGRPVRVGATDGAQTAWQEVSL